jgi:hypothetical protein
MVSNPANVGLRVIFVTLMVCNCAAGDLEAGKPITLKQEVCGALLRDNFDNNRIDPTIWDRAETSEPGLKIEADRGELCLRGTIGELRKDASLSHLRQAYVVSRAFREVDVCLAVKMKMPSGINPGPDNHVINAHLCGVAPDTYPEILLGKQDGPDMERLSRLYWLPKKYKSARGWWMAAMHLDTDPNAYWWKIVGDPLPEFGDEENQFHDALLVYDEKLGAAGAFVKNGPRWRQLGSPEPIIHNLTRVELKLYVLTDRPGGKYDARFDNVRLYPNPKRHPIRLIAVDTSEPFGSNPAHVEPLECSLYTEDGTQLVSKGKTNVGGAVELPVDSPAWMAFPVGAMIKATQGGRVVGSGRITAHDVEGLYPGDVWILKYDNTSSHKATKGTKSVK